MDDSRPVKIVSIPEALPVTGRTGVEFVNLFRSARDETVKLLRKVPAIMETVAALDHGRRYLIEWPDGMEKALKSGAATWRRRMDGTLPVVIRDADEKNILKHLSLREADVPPDLWQGFGQLATQSALAALAEKLEEMDLKLDELRRGARDDRFGLIDSGWHQYEQAKVSIDGARRSRMLENALQSILEGRGQLLRVVASEAERLDAPSRWQQFLKAVFLVDGPTERLGHRLAEITTDVEGAVLATRYATLIHADLGEPQMARTAIRQLTESLDPMAGKMVRLARHCPHEIVAKAEQRWTVINQRLLPAAARGESMLSAVLEGAPIELMLMPNELGGVHD